MSKDEAIAVILQLWDTFALCLQDNCTGEDYDKLNEAIEALRNG